MTSKVSTSNVFLVMRNGPFGETGVLEAATGRLNALLPPSWQLKIDREVAFGDSRVDAVADLTGVDSSSGVRFAVEVKRSGSVSAAVLLSVLRDLRRATGLPVLFVSDYIGPALRAALSAEQMSYADVTGWVRVVNDEPLLLVTGHGAERAPRTRTTSAVTRLNGIAASRTIRALANVDLPCGVRGLAAAADVSPGSVSKLLATLAVEGSVERDSAGAVTAVRMRELIRRWTQDYSYKASNRSVGFYLAPRGLDRTLDRLTGIGGVTLTGSAASRRLLPAAVTPVVPLRLLALYAADPADLAHGLRLVSADPSTANVLIAAPLDPMILPATDQVGATDRGDLPVAPAPLVLADLLTLPARSDAEADQLFDVLASIDPIWRENA